MKNTYLQVMPIMAASLEEFQEDLNTALRQLGSDVVRVEFVQPLVDGFGCQIIFRQKKNVLEEATQKIEMMPPDPYAPAADPIAVIVLHEYQKKMAYELAASAARNTYDRTERAKLELLKKQFETDPATLDDPEE